MTAVAAPAASRPRWLSWPLVALVACLGMLGAAHGFEAAGYAPCDLCLRQREVYWLTAAVSLAGVAAGALRPRLAGVFALAIGLLFLGEAGLAAFHAGVEWKWWPGPTHCSGRGGAVSAGQLGALLNGAKVHAVACDEAAWRMLGLSMAGWNALAALALAVASFIAARRTAHV